MTNLKLDVKKNACGPTLAKGSDKDDGWDCQVWKPECSSGDVTVRPNAGDKCPDGTNACVQVEVLWGLRRPGPGRFF